jgi:hypothetical protein
MLADRLSAIGRRLRSRNDAGVRRRRVNHLVPMASEVSVLEPRCLLSASGLGTPQASMMPMLHANGRAGEEFRWHSSNVVVGRHPSGATRVSVSYWSSGSHPWDAIYGLSGFSLEAGATYEIGVGAYEQHGKTGTVRLVLQEANAPYTSYFLEDFKEGTRLDVRVKVPVSVPNASLQFQFGGQGAREFVMHGPSIHRVLVPGTRLGRKP